MSPTQTGIKVEEEEGEEEELLNTLQTIAIVDDFLKKNKRKLANLNKTNQTNIILTPTHSESSQKLEKPEQSKSIKYYTNNDTLQITNNSPRTIE